MREQDLGRKLQFQVGVFGVLYSAASHLPETGVVTYVNAADTLAQITPPKVMVVLFARKHEAEACQLAASGHSHAARQRQAKVDHAPALLSGVKLPQYNFRDTLSLIEWFRENR